MSGSTTLTTRRRSGTALILTFIMLVSLTAITIAFLYMTSVRVKVMGYDTASSQALWLAEAGLQKAIWNLMTPVGSGGQGESWDTTGTTESLGNGNYTMVVERWDFAMEDNGASASATSQTGGNGPAKAIDGKDGTFWQGDTPSLAVPQEITIAFPYTITINKVRFLSSVSARRPKDYSWQVSSDGTTYTTVVNVTNNNSLDVTDTFTAVSNVNYLKLSITANGGGSGVRVATLEAIGSKVTSTGSVSSLSRKIEQAVVADDATVTAYNQKDWNEIVPAN